MSGLRMRSRTEPPKSPEGVLARNDAFSDSGIIRSANIGWPARETWVKVPPRSRLVDVQRPSRLVLLAVPPGDTPLAVSCVVGICIEIVITLCLARPSTGE